MTAQCARQPWVWINQRVLYAVHDEQCELVIERAGMPVAHVLGRVVRRHARTDEHITEHERGIVVAVVVVEHVDRTGRAERHPRHRCRFLVGSTEVMQAVYDGKLTSMQAEVDQTKQRKSMMEQQITDIDKEILALVISD